MGTVATVASVVGAAVAVAGTAYGVYQSEQQAAAAEDAAKQNHQAALQQARQSKEWAEYNARLKENDALAAVQQAQHTAIQMEQASEEERIAGEYNVRVKVEEAERTQKAGELLADAAPAPFERARSTIRARASASGVVADEGSPLEAIAENARQQEAEVQRVLYATHLSVTGALADADTLKRDNDRKRVAMIEGGKMALYDGARRQERALREARELLYMGDVKGRAHEIDANLSLYQGELTAQAARMNQVQTVLTGAGRIAGIGANHFAAQQRANTAPIRISSSAIQSS